MPVKSPSGPNSHPLLAMPLLELKTVCLSANLEIFVIQMRDRECASGPVECKETVRLLGDYVPIDCSFSFHFHFHSHFHSTFFVLLIFIFIRRI